jgi:hypothetical protein
MNRAFAIVDDALARTAPARRAIHSNNVRSGLIEALAIRYPVVQRLVGDEFFAAMASAFALDHPPSSPSFIFYGADFPDFIDGFASAASLPYLGDVARLENCWFEAYHAADAAPLSREDFAAVAPETLVDVTLTFHPSLAVGASRFPIVSILAAHQGQGALSAIDMSRAETALIARPQLDVEVSVIDLGFAAFLASLRQGETLGSSVAQQDADFDLAAALRRLIASRIVTGITSPSPPSGRVDAR